MSQRFRSLVLVKELQGIKSRLATCVGSYDRFDLFLAPDNVSQNLELFVVRESRQARTHPQTLSQVSRSRWSSPANLHCSDVRRGRHIDLRSSGGDRSLCKAVVVLCGLVISVATCETG